ncbi:MAG TPA: S8 family peptidase [Allosphingosinicella sp.]|nr:S8 family peptidase [Allosphingosinicella sp.]
MSAENGLAKVALLALAVACAGCRDRLRADDADVVPGKYIVSIEAVDGEEFSLTDPKFRARARALRDQLVSETIRGGGEVPFRYDNVLIGFSAAMSDQLARTIDGREGVRVAKAHRVRLAATQSDPPYGLDRIAERAGCLNRTYAYSQTGKGVHVYVIDTGIFSQHPEFQVAPGQSRVSPDVYNPFNDGKQDDDGHGTHVAGTIGGNTFGVAKDVELHSVRVFKRGIETDTGILIEAVDWVTENAKPHRPRVVVNMSLVSGRDEDLDRAVRRSIAQGLTYVVAAGNLDARFTDANACNVSPARVRQAITVGATHPGDDSIPHFSFAGGCLDTFAPGVYIMSARNDLSGQPRIMSGTSMAAAHVSGLAALYLETTVGKPPVMASPPEVWKAVVKASSVHPGTSGWSGIKGSLRQSPNRLSHWGSMSQDGTTDGEVCPAT